MSLVDLLAVTVAIGTLSSTLFSALAWWHSYQSRKKVEEHDRWERWMLENEDRKRRLRR